MRSRLSGFAWMDEGWTKIITFIWSDLVGFGRIWSDLVGGKTFWGPGWLGGNGLVSAGAF